MFIFLAKGFRSNTSIINYFIIQERLGLFFLVFSVNIIQLLIIIIKIGVSPFHFWLFNVVGGLSFYNFLWFLTFQKLPFLVVFLEIISNKIIWLILLGLLLCIIQLFLLKSFNFTILISSTESFSWIIMSIVFSLFNSLFLFFYYCFLIFFLIPFFNRLNFFSLTFELVVIFINIPLRITFFIKIFLLRNFLLLGSFFFLFLLGLIFISIISLGYWLVYFRTTKNKNKRRVKILFFILLSVNFFILIYFLIKNYYIILIGWSSIRRKYFTLV